MNPGSSQVPPPRPPTGRSSSSQPSSGETIHRLKKERDNLTAQLGARKEECSRVNKELMESRNLIDSLKDKIHQSEFQRSQAASQISSLQQHLAESQKSVHDRNAELQSANRFLTIADTVSLSDAVRAVEDLNAEIFQFAAVLADAIVFTPDPSFQPRESSLSGFFSTPFTHALQDSRLDCSLRIEVSVQAILCLYFNQVIGSWNLFSPEFSNNLHSIYSHFLKEGFDPTIPTWRAMTRARIHTPQALQSVQFVEPCAEILSQMLRDIGWRKTEEEGYRALLSGYSQRLSVLTKMAVNLNKTFGEQIVSTDLHVFAISPGNQFSKAEMVDMYESDSRDKTVLCTTSLGVASFEPGSRTRDAQNNVLLLPKVALASVFQETSS